MERGEKLSVLEIKIEQMNVQAKAFTDAAHQLSIKCKEKKFLPGLGRCYVSSRAGQISVLHPGELKLWLFFFRLACKELQNSIMKSKTSLMRPIVCRKKRIKSYHFSSQYY